jgi:4a-hydroxytetrahydrobiopterin dehydratase
MSKKLSRPEIEAALGSLPGWGIDGEKLYREFKFADFPRAFGFMAAMATRAEAMNHHPEWLNVYATVKVWLSTHDVGGVSARDLALAQVMNDYYDRA